MNKITIGDLEIEIYPPATRLKRVGEDTLFKDAWIVLEFRYGDYGTYYPKGYYVVADQTYLDYETAHTQWEPIPNNSIKFIQKI